jgi:hypothetical protein
MKNNYTEYIGFLETEEMNECLMLQALLQGTGKSAIIRDIIHEVAVNNGWTVDTLTTRYAKHLHSQWDLRYRDRIPDFKDYLDKEKEHLENEQKLPKQLIKTIIKKCEEQHRQFMTM